MAHKGIRQYGGEEGGNVALGQLGFKELTTTGNTGDGTFVAFKVIGAASADTATVAATCHQGDDLTATPFLAGEIIWGAFNKITVSAVTDADVHVLCYYG
mgnify:FL=1